MPRPPASEPTDVELQILRILWNEGSASARTVHDALQAEKSTNYSTTVKMLTVMREKGLVECDRSVRPQLYRAAATRAQTQSSMLRRLSDQVFGGSLSGVVLHALQSDQATPDEVREMQRLLASMTPPKSQDTEGAS